MRVRVWIRRFAKVAFVVPFAGVMPAYLRVGVRVRVRVKTRVTFKG